MAPRAALRAAWYALLALAWAVQPVAARAQGVAGASLELGLAGQLVAGSWNPIRVTLRDLPDARLELELDAGSLRDGPRIDRYRADIHGGSGITVFEDDLYLPAFRSLSWTLTSRASVVASGSLGSRDADTRALDLLLSSSPGRWRGAYGDAARLADVAAADLPARAAAYAGVRSLLLDGTGAVPRADAVAAVAAGGATVVLAGSLPSSYAPVERLLDGADAVRLGAGRVVRAPGRSGAVSDALAAASAVAPEALIAAMTFEPMVQAPTALAQPVMLGLAAAFALAVLLMLRFAGGPGLVAALALTLVVSVAGWRLLRPPSAVLQESRTVWLAGGPLALGYGVTEVLTLPAGEVRVPQAGRPLGEKAYWVDADGTYVALSRWHRALIALRPTLAPAALRYDGAWLVNDGPAALREVYVIGLGPQGDLGVGERVRPVAGEDAPIAAPYGRVAAALPPGAAVARDARGLWVALPATLARNGAPR